MTGNALEAKRRPNEIVPEETAPLTLTLGSMVIGIPATAIVSRPVKSGVNAVTAKQQVTENAPVAKRISNEIVPEKTVPARIYRVI